MDITRSLLLKWSDGDWKMSTHSGRLLAGSVTCGSPSKRAFFITSSKQLFALSVSQTNTVTNVETVFTSFTSHVLHCQTHSFDERILCLNKLNKLSPCSWLDKLTDIKDNTIFQTANFAFYVADPATFMASICVLGALFFPLRTACCALMSFFKNCNISCLLYKSLSQVFDKNIWEIAAKMCL